MRTAATCDLSAKTQDSKSIYFNTRFTLVMWYTLKVHLLCCRGDAHKADASFAASSSSRLGLRRFLIKVDAARPRLRRRRSVRLGKFSCCNKHIQAFVKYQWHKHRASPHFKTIRCQVLLSYTSRCNKIHTLAFYFLFLHFITLLLHYYFILLHFPNLFLYFQIYFWSHNNYVQLTGYVWVKIDAISGHCQCTVPTLANNDQTLRLLSFNWLTN